MWKDSPKSPPLVETSRDACLPHPRRVEVHVMELYDICFAHLAFLPWSPPVSAGGAGASAPEIPSVGPWTLFHSYFGLGISAL